MPQPDIEILQVRQDDLGPYAKIRVSLYGETTVIRWGLDPETYNQLHKVVFTHALSEQTGPQYKCFLSLDDTFAPGNPESQAWLLFPLGAHSAKLAFGCTPLFKSNLDWLRNIEDVHALDSLAWDAWFHAYYQAPEAEPSIPERVEQQTRQKRTWPILRIASAAAAVCLIGAAGWFGVSHLHSRHDTPIPPTTNRTLDPVPPAQGTSAPPQTENEVSTSAQAASASEPSSTDQSDGSTASTQDSTSLDASAPATAPEPQDPTVQSPEVFQVPAGEVALTIDDGPTQYTQSIIQALATHHAQATFFFVSNNADKYPDVVKAAVQAGDEVEDHSVSHVKLTTLSTADQKQQIMQAALDLEQYTHQPIGLFRPPYEAFNNTTKRIINQLGMSLALWNRDPEDWNATSPQQLVDRIKTLQASGAVIDLHDRENTALAMPAILDYLESHHLRIVVLPDPLAQKAQKVEG